RPPFFPVTGRTAGRLPEPPRRAAQAPHGSRPPLSRGVRRRARVAPGAVLAPGRAGAAGLGPALGLLADAGRHGGEVVQRPAVLPRLPGGRVRGRAAGAAAGAAGGRYAPAELVGGPVARSRDRSAPGRGVLLFRLDRHGVAVPLAGRAVPGPGGRA